MIQIFTDIQPVLVSLAAIIGAGVAFFGLRTWKEELKGRAEYELARRFLKAVFTLRDAIGNVRHPLMSGGELNAAAVESGLDPDPFGPDSERVTQAARARRWRAVQDATSALRLEEVEAEVLWGPEMAKCTDDLHARIGEVWVAEIEYHERKGEDAEMQDRSRVVELRRIMYGSGSEKDDTANRIREAVQAVEQMMRPKLKPGEPNVSKGILSWRRHKRVRGAGTS